MANHWRIVVKSVEDLGDAKWRPLDKTRALLSGFQDGDRLKDVFVVVECGSHRRETSAFDVTEDGGTKAHIGRTLFVPKGDKTLRFSVVKRHKVQKDALIGEVEEVAAPKDASLRLVRGGKEQGTLLVQIAEVLQSDPKGSDPPAPGAAARAPIAPARRCGCLPCACF